ncbi:MAG: hypothetical protein DHS20C05_24450 [Hyphococcus sp.]|nr:MAG: hypothetical protein DHS20C05_24450 [Marinicaulis sp.]
MKKLLFASVVSILTASAAYAEHHEKGAAEYAAPELTGAFKSEDGFIGTFLPAGYLVVSNEMGVAGFIVKYGAKDGVLWFKNLTAPPDATPEGAECAMNNKGKYNYTEAEGNLTFSLIEDPCTARAEAVASANLMRMAMPEPEAE